MRHLKKKRHFCSHFHDRNIFFSQQDADYVAEDRMRTFMSRIATRVPSLINYFIFVHPHKQIIVSLYEDRNVH